MSFGKFFGSVLDSMAAAAAAAEQMSREERARLEVAVIEKVRREVPLLTNAELRAILSESANTKPRASSGSDKLDLMREHDETVEKITKLKTERRALYYSAEKKDADDQIKRYEDKLEMIKSMMRGDQNVSSKG